jgi:hypothetical protein
MAGHAAQKALDDAANEAIANEQKKIADENAAVLAAAEEKQKILEEQLKKEKELQIEAAEEKRKIQQDFIDNMLGGTAQSFSDSIKQGLMDGLPFAQAFGNSFNKILKNAVYEGLKLKIIQPEIEKMMADIGYTASGGTLTDYDLFNIKLKYGEGSSFYKNLEAQTKTINSVIDQLPGSGETTTPTGVSGRLAQASEDTVALLGGQFNAMRITLEETKVIERQQFLELVKVVKNTNSLKNLNAITVTAKRAVGT